MIKKIIINGVDVKDCGFYLRLDNGVQACLSNDLGNCCETNHNCYYKQLQRKEQECEELKEENKYLKEWERHSATCQECYEDGYETGLMENRTLTRYKQALEPFEDDYFKGLDTKTIAELAKKSIRLTTKNRKLEDALDEIEDLCKLGTKGCLTDCPEYAVGQGCSQNCYENRLKVFLAIINKAKRGEG